MAGLVSLRTGGERECGQVPRVFLPDTLGGKRAGGWVERLGAQGRA